MTNDTDVLYALNTAFLTLIEAFRTANKDLRYETVDETARHLSDLYAGEFLPLYDAAFDRENNVFGFKKDNF